MLEKSEVVRILEEMAVLLDLKGENPFKIRAYQNAARALDTLPGDMASLLAGGQLAGLKGIGESLLQKITALARHGHWDEFDTLKASLPPGLFEMMRIQGLGPKKVKLLYEQLGIATPGELEYACQENRLLTMKGFGQKTQDNILKGLEILRRRNEHTLYPTACEVAGGLLQTLRADKRVLQAEIAGSLRRRKEFIRDVDMVACCREADRDGVMETFVSHPDVEAIIAHGPTKSSVQIKSGLQADLRVVAPEEYPHALLHFTGSKEHNIALRALALKKGIKINEYGLFKGDERILCRDEAEIFQYLGLDYIPPEMREDHGEIEAARQHKLPKLIEFGDIRGLFHNHTVYSDGSADIATMARAARELGYEYIGISDHSKSAFYAHGLSEEQVLAQQKEIDLIQQEMPEIRIFKGIEVDILGDGSLDYDDDILATFDFVIASVHSRFKMGEAEMTARLIAAARNPYVTMLGHLTGRLLLARDGYALDIHAVIDACGETDTAIELNSHPSRLDLDWRYCQYAKQQGVKISINPDAHSPGGLEVIPVGVGIARKGWLEKDDVINTRNRKEIEAWLAKRKKP